MISNVPRRSAFVRALALALLLTPLAAAQGEATQEQQDDGQQQQQQQSQERAGLRFANLVPEGTTVDVLVNGEVVVEELSPASVSPYVFLPAGEQTIEVVSRAALGGAETAPADAAPADPAAAPADPAAAPADPAAAPTEPDQAQDPAAPAPATEEPQPAPVEDASLLEQSVQLEAESYGTLILFRSAGGGQEPQQNGAADEPQDEAQQEQEPQEGEPQEGQAQEEPAQATDAPAADAEGEDAPADAAPQGDGPPPLQGRMVDDAFGELPGAGRAMVRVVHTAADVGPVTVVVARSDQGEDAPQDAPAEGQPEGEGQQEGQPEGEPEAAAQEGQEAQQGPEPIQGEELASGLEGNASSEYAPLRAGPHQLQVQVEDGTVAVDLDEVVFESGLLYTLYVSATDDAQTLVLTPAVDGGVSTQRR